MVKEDRTIGSKSEKKFRIRVHIYKIKIKMKNVFPRKKDVRV